MTYEVLAKFGRRLRLGMVGGGIDSVIGRTHLVSMRVDGFYNLTAGAMSVKPEIAVQSAKQELISKDRIYLDYKTMAKEEANREDGIDVVLIATPPQLHYQVSKEFLENGIDVICEKPLTKNLEEAINLKKLINDNDRLFCLTHCYSGYPMVRQARDMIKSGELGNIKLIEGELCAGDPGVVNEPENPANRHWRFKKTSMGEGAIMGEVASHAHHIVSYVTGLRVEEVSAELSTFAKDREVFDNSYVTARFEGGARGRIWGSYVAAGNDHGLSFRIFGEKGGLIWHQEESEVLWYKPIGKAAVRIARGYDSNSSDSLSGSRFRPGHPEGYALAFANLYTDFAMAIIYKKLKKDPSKFLNRIPGILDGIDVMALIDAAMHSNNNNGEWVKVYKDL